MKKLTCLEEDLRALTAKVVDPLRGDVLERGFTRLIEEIESFHNGHVPRTQQFDPEDRKEYVMVDL